MMTDLPDKTSAGEPLQTVVFDPVRPYSVSRLQSLDTLRGVAVLGALFVSVWFFGGFGSNQQNGLLLQSKGLNYRLWGVVELLLDGKMRALISFVFGAGMVLFFIRPLHHQPALTAGDRFIRRQMWMIAFGLINAFVFLWQGDMLFHLGIMGIFLFPFVRLGVRGLLIAAVIATLIFSAKNYWNYTEDRTAYSKYVAITEVEKKISKDSLAAAQKKIPVKEQKIDSLSKQQQEDKSAWEGIAGNKKYDPKKDEQGVKEMRNGSYGKVWSYIVPAAQSKEAQWTYQTGIWDFAGMILLGMALFKAGFFEPGFSKQRYMILALAGLTGGLLLGWFRLQYNQYALQDYARYVAGHGLPYNLFFPFERGLLALGYAASILLLMQWGLLKFLWRSFARTGQMALSNYLLQSIFCTLFFTGVGMGYFGRLQQYQLYLFVVELSIVQIVFSTVWLNNYTHGPAEWLLRCLVQKKWLPNKINRNELPGLSVTPVS